MSHTYAVYYSDGRVGHPAASQVRQSIAMQQRKVGEAFARGNIQLAQRYAKELNDYQFRTAKYLVPTRPAVRLR